MRSAALSEVENANKSMIHKFQSQLEIAASGKLLSNINLKF